MRARTWLARDEEKAFTLHTASQIDSADSSISCKTMASSRWPGTEDGRRHSQKEN